MAEWRRPNIAFLGMWKPQKSTHSISRRGKWNCLKLDQIVLLEHHTILCVTWSIVQRKTCNLLQVTMINLFVIASIDINSFIFFLSFISTKNIMQIKIKIKIFSFFLLSNIVAQRRYDGIHKLFAESLWNGKRE